MNEVESEMMDVRWKTFTFFHQMKISETRDIPSCQKCFADSFCWNNCAKIRWKDMQIFLLFNAFLLESTFIYFPWNVAL